MPDLTRIEHLRKEYAAFMQMLTDAMGTFHALTGGIEVESAATTASAAVAMQGVSDALEEAHSKSAQILRHLKMALAKKLINEGTDQIRLTNGTILTVVGKSYFRPPAKSKDLEGWNALVGWLEEHYPGQAVSEEVHISISGEALNDVCKARLEKREPLPPGINEYNEITVRITKPKRK